MVSFTSVEKYGPPRLNGDACAAGIHRVLHDIIKVFDSVQKRLFWARFCKFDLLLS